MGLYSSRFVPWSGSAQELPARSPEKEMSLGGRDGKMQEEDPASHFLGWSGLGVLVLFVPGHLDGFQLFFVRGLRIVGELWQGHNPRMHIGESDG